MKRSFRREGLPSNKTRVRSDNYEAELFFEELTGRRTARYARHAWPPPRRIVETYNDMIGLPEDDEESALDFDAEFVEPDNSPNGANAPFAPLLSGTGHWPLITSDSRGRAVAYRTTAGAWLGERGRSFGANRSSGTRYHVGVDLFGRFGDSVVAIADGRIVRFFGFCCGDNKTSWALLVQHANVVVNYGEVAPDSLRRNGLRVGSNVTAGQVIGRVGRNPRGSSMLHFETYTTGTTRSYQWMRGRTRPTRLLNPTRLLLQLQETGLPRPTVRVPSTPATKGSHEEIGIESLGGGFEDNLNENDWYGEEDFNPTEALPSRRWASCNRYTANDARWAADNVSPDYRHLNVSGVCRAFTFNARHLERLCRLNRFNVTSGQDEVLFGLRGCKIVGGASEGALVNSVQLSEDLPDHFLFHCVLGVWKRSTRQIAVFTGSTVPNWGQMCKQVQQRGQNANLLPTGRYLYTVGQHKGSVTIDGAFILGREVVVLRSNDDLIYETTDLWDRCSPGDNIHPSFSPAYAEFSSAGCQTVSGTFSGGRHRGNWATFRQRAGLDPNNNRDRFRDRFVYVLLTGRDARLVSLGHRAALDRLRFGSSGPGAQALQTELKRRRLYTGSINGIIDPSTLMAYIQWQQSTNSGAADAIVTPTIGRSFGFDLVRRQSVPRGGSRTRERILEYA